MRASLVLVAVLGVATTYAACDFSLFSSAGSGDVGAVPRDGKVLLRYARGITDANLVANASPGAATSNDITTRITARPSLDVNCNGNFDAYDALLISRHLAGFRDDGLTHGITLAGQRNTSALIQTYLDNACTDSFTGCSASVADDFCGYSYNAFNGSPSVNATSTSSWTCTTTSRVLTANGIPDHSVGTFPNVNNPNSITSQSISATYTLTPTLTNIATELGGPRGVTGYVLNGVKIDAGTAGSCPNNATGNANCSLIGNTGTWSIEALGQSSFNFGVDINNAHVQPGGAYHYHGMPEGFIALQGGGPTKMTLIGWAADGFPIYARYGYSVASDATSPIKVIQGSYQKITSVPATRPSTSLYVLGTFRQDWQYVAGSGDLDECNGRTGVTPEFPGGTYHYYATDSYPYLQRCIKGSR